MLHDTQVYPVGDARQITLDVRYGETNPGSTSTVWQGRVEVVEVGEPKRFDRGGGPLQGSILFCKSSVKDVNTNTNRTSVTYRLSGGGEAREYPYEITVPAHGGIGEYSINFVLV